MIPMWFPYFPANAGGITRLRIEIGIGKPKQTCIPKFRNPRAPNGTHGSVEGETGNNPVFPIRLF